MQKRFCSRDGLCVTRGVAGRYPGSFPVGVTRDMWRSRRVVRTAPGNAFAGNVALPGGIPGGLTARDTWHSRTTSGGILPAWGTRDTWHTRNAPGNTLSVEHSGHVAYSQCSRRVLSAWAFGTRGVLGRLPEGSHSLGTRGHVACSEGFRTGSLSLGTRGHVALSEGIWKVALGVGFGTRVV